MNHAISDVQGRTTWQPPAEPPAISSHCSLILPVSGSIARERTKSFTVSLIAFSGATPCAEHVHENTECVGGSRTHDKLWSETAIESDEPFITEDLLYAIKAVFVQQLPDDRAPLVLHPTHITTT